MKKNKRLAFLTIGFTAAIFSCTPEKVDPTAQDDFTDTDEAVEVKVPEINFELSGLAEKLHNEVTLTVSGKSDDDVIEKVAFFLNDQPLGEDEEAPYEFLWNTKDGEDGAYVLKAVASNASGEGEATKDVVVKNSLLVVNIDDRFYQERRGEKQDSWVFLSDKNGDIIGKPQQVEDGARLSWQRPSGFDSDTVCLNRLDYSDYYPEYYAKPYKNLLVSTYPNLMLDEIFLKGYFRNSQEKEAIGKYDIKIENDFDGTKSYDYSTSSQFSTAGAINTSDPTIRYSGNLYEESMKAFSSYESTKIPDKLNEREKYYRLDELQVGKSYEFHTNEYTPMEERTIYFPFNFNSMYISTNGYFKKDEVAGFRIDYLSLKNGNPNEFKIFYADIFPIQATFIYGSLENKNFNTFMLEKVPEVFNIPDISATVHRDEENNIQVTTQGTYDIGNASWEHTINNETEQYKIRRKIWFSNQSSLSYAMPEIPATLLEIYPLLNQQLEYQSAYMIDNKALTTYEEMMKYYFTDTFSGIDYAPYFALTIDVEKEAEGGRLQGNKGIEHSDDFAKAEQLRAKGIVIF